MLVLPFVIIALMTISGFNPNSLPARIAGIIWFILLVNSISISTQGFILFRDFKKEIEEQTNRGFPIKSMKGFDSLNKSIRNVYSSSFFVSIIVFLSLLTYLFVLVVPTIIAIVDNSLLFGFTEELQQLQKVLSTTMVLIAISLVLIAIGIALLLVMPEKPALQPGALMKYYYPSSIATTIDNFLSDTIFSFLDPITRLKWDDFSNQVARSLHPMFYPEEDPTTRLELAREKILLLAYLEKSIPRLFSREIVNDELQEIFETEEKLKEFYEGKNSGISWEVIFEILHDVEKEIPEVFDIINRIIIELKDNLLAFKQKNIVIMVAAPETIQGNRNPFRILVFMLNNDLERFNETKRPVAVKLKAEGSDDVDEYPLELDEAEVYIDSEDELPVVSKDGEDMIGILTRILQVGDAVWFQVFRTEFGKHIFNIRVEEDGNTIFGTSMVTTVVRDIKFYVKEYGGRLSALSGLLLPVLSILPIPFLPF